MKKHAVIILLGLTVVSCAGVSSVECQQADWYAVGHTNAEEGRRLSSTLALFQKECGQFNITPDTQKFEAGYNEGLLTYCTNENGYDEGIENNKYLKICPEHLESDFLKGYKAGKMIYRQNQTLKNQTYNKKIN